ncbi:UNVERIFIED_CONTAM: hypothetical protein RMT77_001391 [Armadillidium vulgare]
MDVEIHKWCDELGLKGKEATEFIELHKFDIDVYEYIQLCKEMEMENDDIIKSFLVGAEIRRIRCGTYYDRFREVSEREAAAEKFERKYKLLENEFLSKIEETPNPIIEVISTKKSSTPESVSLENNVIEIEKPITSSQVLPIEFDESNDESPAIMTSPEHSDNNTSQTDTKKTEELQISHEEHEHNDTTAKEPLQFPDSPSSVQSEPALQIDEDEQIETSETSITEEKVNVVREVAALPQERSSVWNTPESDIQEGKPLGLTEESLENKNVGTTICEEEKNSESTSVPVSGDKYNSANEADVIQKNETSNFPSDEAPKVDNESNPYSKTACDTVLTTVDNCSASVNSESVVDKDVKEDIKLSDSPVPEIKSECSSNLVTVKEEPNDLPNDSFLPDSKEDMTEESSKTVENIVKKPEELIAVTSVVSGDEKCMETSIEEKDKRLEGVLNSETECKNESMISDSQDFHTPSKSSEDLNTSVESSTTEMSTPEKDFKLEEPEIRNFTPRGRARGRGRRGCRRVVDNASSAVMSTILTRSSSANAKNSKPRGRRRSIKNTEIGKKGQKRETNKPATPRSPSKLSEEVLDIHDSAGNTRKSRRLREKNLDDDPNLQTTEGDLESETPPAPLTRSRGRIKKDDNDDERHDSNYKCDKGTVNKRFIIQRIRRYKYRRKGKIIIK